jgi:hypothetical protein
MPPTIFTIRRHFNERMPSEVRGFARQFGFKLQEKSPSAARIRHASEVWLGFASDGFAFVRLDNVAGAKPHYHKEWIAHEHLRLYLAFHDLTPTQKTRLEQVKVLYHDFGHILGDTHHFRHPDESVWNNEGVVQARLKDAAFEAHQIRGKPEQ